MSTSQLSVLERLTNQFLLNWYPKQFLAWKRSKQSDSVTRSHQDAKKEFEQLPDRVKLDLFALVPLQLDLLVRQGGGALQRLRAAGAAGKREQVEDDLIHLAASYHQVWLCLRLQQQTFLQNPPVLRPDDVPWAALEEQYRTECIEIVWQLCVILGELSVQDFNELLLAADD